MPRVTVVLNPDKPRKHWRYDHIDLCINCYPPDAKPLASECGVGVAWAAAAIKDAGFYGHFHENYEELDRTCDICGKLLDNNDN